MAEATFYLFDGFNLLHAGGFADSREMTDKLASFVAEKGARGVLVFDGTGEDLSYGPLEVRFAEDADSHAETEKTARTVRKPQMRFSSPFFLTVFTTDIMLQNL